MTRRDLEQRLANTTWSRPPENVPMGTCWCGGAYMDTDIGADSHEVVMGHRPAKKHDRPASESGGAMCAGSPASEGEPPISSTETALHSSDEDAASARDPTTDPGQNDPPADDEPRE